MLSLSNAAVSASRRARCFAGRHNFHQRTHYPVPLRFTTAVATRPSLFRTRQHNPLVWVRGGSAVGESATACFALSIIVLASHYCHSSFVSDCWERAKESVLTRIMPDHPLWQELPRVVLGVDWMEHDHDHGATRRRNDTPSTLQGAHFPSLQAELLYSNHQTAGPGSFPLNSVEGIPIHNDYFTGHMRLVLRPLQPKDDPNVCKNSNHRFELQIQGKLKRAPQGPVMCGAELVDPLILSPSVSYVAELLLGMLVRVLGPGMDYRMGDQAHISFPLVSCMDQCIVTKPRDTPPPLGPSLRDSQHQHPHNDSSNEVDWNTDDTYTMSFASSCIDLATWSIVHPFTIPLANFWGKSMMRLVVYEQGGEATSTSSSSRGDRSNNKNKNNNNYKNKYWMALQMKFLGVPSLEQEQTETMAHVTGPSALMMTES